LVVGLVSVLEFTLVFRLFFLLAPLRVGHLEHCFIKHSELIAATTGTYYWAMQIAFETASSEALGLRNPDIQMVAQESEALLRIQSSEFGAFS